MAAILILEDEQDFGRLLEASLQDNGHTAIVCLDVPAAVDVMATMTIDLVIADLFIKKVNQKQPDGGLALIQHIRTAERDSTEHLPIIVISGKVKYPGIENALDRAVSLGADVALEKPFTPPELLELIDGLLTETKNSLLDRIRGFFRNAQN